MKTFRLIVVALVLIVLSLGAAVFVQAQRNQTDQNATTKAHDPASAPDDSTQVESSAVRPETKNATLSAGKASSRRSRA